MIAIATGKVQLDQYLLKGLDNSQIVNYQEYLVTNIFEIVILTSSISGDYSLEELFFKLMQNGSRVIYLTNVELPEEQYNIRLCLKYGIYDIYYDESIETEKVLDLINNPKSLKNDDIQEFFVKYLNEEILEEKKVSLKDKLKNKVGQVTNNQSEINQEQKIIEEIKVIEKIIEKVTYEVPHDYKKIVAFTGLNNIGKSTLAVMVADILSQNKKVALIDNTANQDYEFYYSQDSTVNSISNNSTIRLNKNLYLYTKKSFNKNLLELLDTLKNTFSILIIDSNSLDPSILRYLDEVFIVTDCTASHTKEISKLVKNYINLGKPVQKLKIIYNKVVIENNLKILNKLNVHNEVIEKDEVELQKICEPLKYYKIKLLTNIDIHEKLLNFDIDTYHKDETFKMQLETIANDIYLTTKAENKNFFKRIFRL